MGFTESAETSHCITSSASRSKYSSLGESTGLGLRLGPTANSLAPWTFTSNLTLCIRRRVLDQLSVVFWHALFIAGGVCFSSSIFLFLFRVFSFWAVHRRPS